MNSTVEQHPSITKNLDKLERIAKIDNEKMVTRKTKSRGNYPPKFKMGQLASIPTQYFGYSKWSYSRYRMGR